jgi:hypothetical protein
VGGRRGSRQSELVEDVVAGVGKKKTEVEYGNRWTLIGL